MTSHCPSTFLGNQCGCLDEHLGPHYNRDSSGHITTWDDHAADPTKAAP